MTPDLSYQSKLPRRSVLQNRETEDLGVDVGALRELGVRQDV
jgi:hypothetical protein